jgi:hypothetical protein
VTRGSRRRPVILSILIVFGLFAGSAPLALEGIAGNAAALTGCSRTASSANSFQYLINNLPSGGTLCLTADIRSSVPIRIKRSNITIDGRGHSIRGVGYHAVLEVRCATNVTVRNLIAAGDNPRGGTYVRGREHGHGFAVHGGRNIRFSGVRTWHTYGDGFYLANCGSSWADGVTIQNSLAAWNGRQGIAVVAARNVVVENMTYKNIAFHLISVEPDWSSTITGGAENITFDGGTSYGWVGRFTDGSIGTSAVYIGTPYGAISGWNAPRVAGITVRRLRVTDSKYGIWSQVTATRGYRIASVTFADNRGAGRWWTASRGVITCSDTDGFTATGNNQAVTHGQGMYMARSVNCSGASASGNTGDGLVGQLRN